MLFLGTKASSALTAKSYSKSPHRLPQHRLLYRHHKHLQYQALVEDGPRNPSQRQSYSKSGKLCGRKPEKLRKVLEVFQGLESGGVG